METTLKERRIIAAMRNNKTSEQMITYLEKQNLNGFERTFIDSIQTFARLSIKQMRVLRTIYNKHKEAK